METSKAFFFKNRIEHPVSGSIIARNLKEAMVM
jgi:hypothetical protein